MPLILCSFKKCPSPNLSQTRAFRYNSQNMGNILPSHRFILPGLIWRQCTCWQNLPGRRFRRLCSLPLQAMEAARKETAKPFILAMFETQPMTEHETCLTCRSSTCHRQIVPRRRVWMHWNLQASSSARESHTCTSWDELCSSRSHKLWTRSNQWIYQTLGHAFDTLLV